MLVVGGDRPQSLVAQPDQQGPARIVDAEFGKLGILVQLRVALLEVVGVRAEIDTLTEPPLEQMLVLAQIASIVQTLEGRDAPIV